MTRAIAVTGPEKAHIQVACTDCGKTRWYHPSIVATLAPQYRCIRCHWLHVKKEPKDELRIALREWCQWVGGQAILAHDAAEKRGGMLSPEGQPTTWLDHCGMYERALIEAAMAAGLWQPSSTSLKAAE